MSYDTTIKLVTEIMDELEAYRNRAVVIKIGGNSIAEDGNFLTKIAKQICFLRANGVRVVLVHGGGPQIDDALRAKNVETSKGPDGRRVTTPQAMKIVHKTMCEVNLAVSAALIKAGCKPQTVVPASRIAKMFLQVTPADEADKGKTNRIGKPSNVQSKILQRHIDKGRIVVLHSVGIGPDGRTVFNVNGDDYAMAVAIALKAKRLIMVTNVAGVLDKNRERIPVLDPDMAAQLMADKTITGGMIPKVESAVNVVKQGVGGVAIIDGFAPYALLAEMLTHEGYGTLVRTKVG
ncbi:MAG: acetylglutamate kinase [Bdellovibrionales bacterium]